MSMSSYEVGPVMAVSDLGRAREFYEQKLGLSPGGDDPEGVRLRMRERHRHLRLPLARARWESRPPPWPAGSSTTSRRWSTS